MSRAQACFGAIALSFIPALVLDVPLSPFNTAGGVLILLVSLVAFLAAGNTITDEERYNLKPLPRHATWAYALSGLAFYIGSWFLTVGLVSSINLNFRAEIPSASMDFDTPQEVVGASPEEIRSWFSSENFVYTLIAGKVYALELSENNSVLNQFAIAPVDREGKTRTINLSDYKNPRQGRKHLARTSWIELDDKWTPVRITAFSNNVTRAPRTYLLTDLLTGVELEYKPGELPNWVDNRLGYRSSAYSRAYVGEGGIYSRKEGSNTFYSHRDRANYSVSEGQADEFHLVTAIELIPRGEHTISKLTTDKGVLEISNSDFPILNEIVVEDTLIITKNNAGDLINVERVVATEVEQE